MALVQKTITLEVVVTIEIDEDVIGTDGVDDPFDLAQTVCYGLDGLNSDGDLFHGGTVKEYSANVLDVSDTNNEYN
jgi:hypothetical protein